MGQGVDSREELSAGQKWYIVRVARRSKKKTKSSGPAYRCEAWAHAPVYYTLSSLITAYRVNMGYRKERITNDPPLNGKDAVNKVIAGLETITRDEWVNMYRHAQCFEKHIPRKAADVV
ncbi:hypothetical protein PHMEG_00017090 [Phytophthora megakarya]|uniref:Uncharacterized protein n=1 Tax=Phytophthora megakarya TaxID=4795 RepID=A0A225VZS3_9STRA|nr:hypothetical protein PHMEG_00017090 [Phytophthora megakarya]